MSAVSYNSHLSYKKRPHYVIDRVEHLRIMEMITSPCPFCPLILTSGRISPIKEMRELRHTVQMATQR